MSCSCYLEKRTTTYLLHHWQDPQANRCDRVPVRLVQHHQGLGARARHQPGRGGHELRERRRGRDDHDARYPAVRHSEDEGAAGQGSRYHGVRPGYHGRGRD